jgi:phage shock protein PspC (stress-responsive transcriptional regulator)
MTATASTPHQTAPNHRPFSASDASLEGARQWFRENGLVRPRRGRVISGVSAGFARRHDVNPLVMRLVSIASVFTLPLLYPALWILMPSEDA